MAMPGSAAAEESRSRVSLWNAPRNYQSAANAPWGRVPNDRRIARSVPGGNAGESIGTDAETSALIVDTLTGDGRSLAKLAPSGTGE